MTSKLNVDVSTHRKLNQKTMGYSTTSKRYGTSSKNEEEKFRENIEGIFEHLLPVRIIPPVEPEPEKKEFEKKTETKDESKEEVKESTEKKIEESSTVRKEETSKEFEESGVEQSEEELKRKEQREKEKRDRDLQQIIYITISEVPTQILFYIPSTKCMTLKNDDEIKTVNERKENYKEYEIKMKNKESFAKKGIQTISRFKASQVVTTSSTKDVETGTTDNNKKVNCLNYAITDIISEKRQKNEDYCQNIQKILDRSVKKEMRQKMKKLNDISMIESSTRSIGRSGVDESTSFIETVTNSSIHSSRRPKIQKSQQSQDRSTFNENNSSFMKSSASEMASQIEAPESKVMQHNIKRAPNESIPDTLANPLKYVERLLSQNKFHFQQIAYKDYPINIEDFENQAKKAKGVAGIKQLGKANQGEGESAAMELQKKAKEFLAANNEDPMIKKLFTYSIDTLLKTNNIGIKYVCHSMDWNTNNLDLLAAAYGDPDINSKEPGFLCFWTLKNPLHPERVIKTPRGLTYCNFSRKNPYLIVCSDYQGEIMIYDLRRETNEPIADSTEVKDKHTDIVWEAKWIERPNDKNEIIITTSSDGKVKEWSLKKGLEVVDLLKMKKSTSFPLKQLNPFAKYIHKTKTDSKDGKDIKDTLIFREANGLSFDFPKNDTTVYYVALEECTIHRCRISYKDQYTDNYYGHQGPVNKIRCNPFDPNILISCSYDWTIKIWNSKRNYPVMNLHSEELCHQVNDIQWSDDTSTIFGCVADDGRIEIWDLARNAVQPIIIEDKGAPSKKSISFCLGGKVVATGCSDGTIDIFRIYNLEHKPLSDDHQIKHLDTVLKHNSDLDENDTANAN
ncbi:MAG: hypothetical protein MJ252_21905 [archaeon]|nr:hypothetical protein [archaeon]